MGSPQSLSEWKFRTAAKIARLRAEARRFQARQEKEKQKGAKARTPVTLDSMEEDDGDYGEYQPDPIDIGRLVREAGAREAGSSPGSESPVPPTTSDATREKATEYVMDLLNGLRNEPLRIAMDIGVDRLAGPDGYEILVARIEEIIIPKRREEASILLNEGSRPRGLLSRQPRESMISYVTRRERWYNTLKTLNPGTMISENVLAEQLLDQSGLSEMEKRMTLVVTGNKIGFTEFAEAMKAQHTDTHLKEQRSFIPQPSPSSSSGFNPRPAKPRRRFRPQAFHGEADEPVGGWEDQEDDDYEDDDRDATGQASRHTTYRDRFRVRSRNRRRRGRR